MSQSVFVVDAYTVNEEEIEQLKLCKKALELYEYLNIIVGLKPEGDCSLRRTLEIEYNETESNYTEIIHKLNKKYTFCKQMILLNTVIPPRYNDYNKYPLNISLSISKLKDLIKQTLNSY